MYQAQTSLGGEAGTGWSTKNVDPLGSMEAGCERTRPPLPPPPLPTGLMKFIKVKIMVMVLIFRRQLVTVLQLTKLRPAVRSFYTPLSISAPFYGYLKLLKAARKGKKSKQRFEVTPRNCIRKRPRTNPLCYMLGSALREIRSTAVTMGLLH